VSSAPDVVGHVSILDSVDRAVWSALRLAARVIAPADPAIAHAIVDAALADGALVTAAVDDMTVVGLVLTDRPRGEMLALGVAPSHRRRGLARDLLAVEAARPDGSAASAEISMAERDVADPLDRSVRASIARQSLERAGFSAVLPDADLVAIDQMLLAFERRLSRRGRRSAPDRTSLDRD
jgi:ribosomal protein S18 acetylase RimI-like enzyme